MRKIQTSLERIKDRMKNGKTVCVSALTGRTRWWVHVIEIHESEKFVKVKGMSAFGKPRWVGINDVMFT